MKIGLAHKRLDLRGGTERDFVRTAEGLRDLGHEVHLFCAEYAFPAPTGTIPHRVPNLSFGRTAGLWSFAVLAPRAIQRHGCDVAIGFGRMLQQDVVRSGGGSHLVFLRKMEQAVGWRHALWHRISIYHRSVLAIEKRQFAADNFKKIIAVSNEVKREIAVAYGVPGHKIAVIYNGVDPERFHPRLRQTMRRKVRKRWGIPEDAAVALFVGSGFRRKGLDRLLSVWGFPGLARVYLLVIGEDVQKNRYQFLAEKVCGSRIVFAGLRTDVENYYAAADVLVLPAVQEAFGNVVLEALASGLPVVASKTVGASELIVGSLTEGIVARPEDPYELEAAVLRMLKRARHPTVADEARKIGERFSWRNHFRQLEDCLLEIVGRSRHASAS